MVNETKPIIFFVDDEVKVLRSLRNALFEMDDEWSLEFFESGEEALDAMESRSVNVLVTDILMPGMNGYEFTRQVRGSHPDIYCIALSGETSRHGVDDSEDIFDKFLSKPCSQEELIDAIKAGVE